MSYSNTESVIIELFTENLNHYPENYQDLKEAIETIEEVANGYYENRTQEEIKRDEVNDITLSRYIELGFVAFSNWLEDNLELDDVQHLIRWSGTDLQAHCNFVRDLYTNGVFHPSFNLTKGNILHFHITLEDAENKFNAIIASIDRVELI